MSIEDHMTTESDAKAMTVKVSLDIQGYADEIADEVDEQVFHAVAARKGYVKERTCRIVWNDMDDTWECDACGAAVGHDLVSYCEDCGAKVVEE